LVRKGHHEKARELQAVLVRVSKAIVSESGIAGLKHVMDLRGYRGGLPRLPLQPLQLNKRRALVNSWRLWNRPSPGPESRDSNGFQPEIRTDLMRRFLASII